LPPDTTPRHFTGSNPSGHSSTNLGSLYKGLVRDTSRNFKHLRKTRHTHNPVDDARGNAGALLEMRGDGFGYRVVTGGGWKSGDPVLAVVKFAGFVSWLV